MRQEIETHIAQACKELFAVDVAVELTRPDAQFGDYATNIALQLSKQVGKNPREIAETLRTKIAEHAAVASVDIAGPGFLNLRLTDEALAYAITAEPAQTYAGQTVVAEYSDPNPFKVLHAGHLYTTLVGDVIANLLAAAGGTVHRVNFGGDVGLHVGKTMWAILQELGGEHPEKLESIEPEQRLVWLSEQYGKGNNAYDDDEQAKAAIVELNKKVYDLHAQNDRESPFAHIYWTCRAWSYDGFDKLYQKLQVTPFEKYYPESSTTELGVKTVQEGLKIGVFKESDGAVVFAGEEHGLHTRVFLNSNGLPTYETKDLGLAQHKWNDYQFDKNVIITGNDIIEYMKVVLAALSNFHPQAAQRTTHLTHGQIKLAGGVKMSSRKGNILQADHVLQAASEAQKQATDNDDWDVTLAAVKYAFLKQRIGGDIIYDPAESVSVQGDSGPYLQYALVRARSILSKATTPAAEQYHEAFTAGERALVRKMTEYTEVVEKSVRELLPNHICTYLYELAQAFNRFYEDNRVIGDDRESVRVKLVTDYASILHAGLDLLGIPAPDKM